MAEPEPVLEPAGDVVPDEEWRVGSGLKPSELLEGGGAFYGSLSGNQRRLMTLAIRESSRLFPHDTDDDGRKDAVRHAFWAALLMFHMGLSNALAATGVHAAFAGAKDPPERRGMDDLNHARGFEIGLACSPDCTDRQILARIMDAYQRGELRVLRPDGRRAPRRR